MTKKKQTKKEIVLAALAAAKHKGNVGRDVEAAHWDADDALLKYIDDKEIEAAYEAVEKWYA